MKKKNAITLAILASCGVIALVIAQLTQDQITEKLFSTDPLNASPKLSEEEMNKMLQTPEGQKWIRENVPNQ